MQVHTHGLRRDEVTLADGRHDPVLVDQRVEGVAEPFGLAVLAGPVRGRGEPEHVRGPAQRRLHLGKDAAVGGGRRVMRLVHDHERGRAVRQDFGEARGLERLHAADHDARPRGVVGGDDKPARERRGEVGGQAPDDRQRPAVKVLQKLATVAQHKHPGGGGLTRGADGQGRQQRALACACGGRD